MNTDNLMALVKASIVPVVLGYGMWKMGPNNLVKAMGAGVLGVQAVTVVRSVTGV